MQTSKVGDTSVYTISCHLSKHSLPAWSSISNGKWKILSSYPRR